jgi:hypothetical protein
MILGEILAIEETVQALHALKFSPAVFSQRKTQSKYYLCWTARMLLVLR